MTDDVNFEVAGTSNALKVAAERYNILAREFKVTLREQLLESQAAVIRSRTLLSKLNARKPPRFL